MEEKRFPHLKVDNNKTGFKEILKWARKEKVNLKDCMFCMENTGHYGLDLYSFLEQKGIEYCSICPLVMKRSMGISRDKNDKIDSARIATFAFEKAYKLKPSKLASEDILKLKQLQSERAMYVSERAKYKAYISDKCDKNSSTIKRMSLLVETLSRQIEAVEAEIQAVIQRNEELKTSYDLITSVPGHIHFDPYEQLPVLQQCQTVCLLRWCRPLCPHFRDQYPWSGHRVEDRRYPDQGRTLTGSDECPPQRP